MSESITFNHEDKEGSEEVMSTALYVEEADNDEDDNRPPQDGMAYLRQVIKERKRVPETVTAEVTATKKKKVESEPVKNYENDRTKAPPPDGCCPSAAWQRDQVSQFSEVRLKASRHSELGRQTGEVGPGAHMIPDKKNEALWCHMILGGQVWRQVCTSRDDEEEGSKASTDVSPDQPKLSFIMSVPVHVCEHVLDYLVTWLAVTGWRSEYGAWLYSLLVRLEKPLTPDTSSMLRDLVLVCARERRKIAAASDATETVKDENIAALNLFICIVAKYFGQTDLADVED